jgi:tetratricopeptide (TPR) repeat protein
MKTLKQITVINTMIKPLALLVLFCGFNISVYANTPAQSDFSQALITLQHQWADTNYAKDKDLKKSSFLALQEESIKLTSAFPKQAEAWIWHGIVQSSYAGFKGGLGAISLVDDAKEALEKALILDENALQGSAHTSLGILYLKVPGWPVSFGDDDESERHLKTALKMNPTGIDVNYFLAEFYMEQDEYKKAKEHLIAASSAPARPNRKDADKFRQVEIETLLTQVNKELR